MIDQISDISSQQSAVSGQRSVEATRRSEDSHRVSKENEHNKISDSENIKRKSEYKKVAKEMESLFAYQLVKVMRETADSMSSEKKGQGYDTYMSLFDMEISKLFAERGLGLQDAIIRWMERMPDINNTGEK